MLDTWILTKLDLLRDERLILLRDPQRMIQRGARAVDGWGEENGFTVLFCSGNLALRERLRSFGQDPEMRLLLVDVTREDGRLFYPDLDARCPPNARLTITLRDFLVEKTGDSAWPQFVNDLAVARLLSQRLAATLEAYECLRKVSKTRFTDNDLYRIVIGAVLGINAFKALSPAEIRRVCLTQHDQLEELEQSLPDESRQYLHHLIQDAPKPFCWLLERDPEPILRAFTLAAVLHQHGLDYSLLLSNIDPALQPYREIDPQLLDSALKDQIAAEPGQVLADVLKVEAFLLEDRDRLKFVASDLMKVDDVAGARSLLEQEHLSEMLRSLALGWLLFDLVMNLKWQEHAKTLRMLEQQEQSADFIVLRRSSEQWQQLMAAYRRAISIYQLTGMLRGELEDLSKKETAELEFSQFHRLWNEEKLNRLDFYISDLERMLRVGNILMVPMDNLWPAYCQQLTDAREKFRKTSAAAKTAFARINTRFQDLYHRNYTKWIQQADAPVIFTHQFLARMLKAYWDPRSGQKAVILVFDGLRTDAWDEFVRPVMEEKYDLIASQPGSALIPTETELSRKAISAGALPVDFPGKSRQELAMLKIWLKENMAIEPDFSIVCDQDTVASGMTVRYNSKLLDYIVFNFTDDNLHHNNQDMAFIYTSTVRDIIRQDVRAVLRDLPAGALVFITSDHGFTAMPEKSPDATLAIPDEMVNEQQAIKYSSVRATGKPDAGLQQRVVSFDIRALRIPIPNNGGNAVQWVLFPRPGSYFAREAYGAAPDRYSHGGVSLAECMVPMVVMGPRAEDAGLLILDEILQSGSMVEGDPLSIVVKVRSRQIITEPLSFSLSFSLDNIPERKEIFINTEKEYGVELKAKLPEITDVDRERGYMLIPLTVTLGHRVKDKSYRQSRTVDLRVRIDTTRLRRRIDSKLDLMMGKMPKEMRG